MSVSFESAFVRSRGPSVDDDELYDACIRQFDWGVFAAACMRKALPEARKPVRGQPVSTQAYKQSRRHIKKAILQLIAEPDATVQLPRLPPCGPPCSMGLCTKPAHAVSMRHFHTEYRSQFAFARGAMVRCADADANAPRRKSLVIRSRRKTLVVGAEQVLFFFAPAPDATPLGPPAPAGRANTHVVLRPFARDFLRRMAEHYEIVLFTTAPLAAATAFALAVDGDKKLVRKIYHDKHCSTIAGVAVKNISALRKDPASTVIVDAGVQACCHNLANLIPIDACSDTRVDNELPALADYLVALAGEDDVRPKLEAGFRVIEHIHRFCAGVGS